MAPARGVELLGVELERRGVARAAARSRCSAAAALADLRAARRRARTSRSGTSPPRRAGRRRSRRCGSAGRGRARSARRAIAQHGRAHALVVRRQEADERDQQRRGVERVGVVVLAEDAALVDAALEDVRADLVGDRLPALGELVARRAARRAARRGRARPSTSASRRRSAAARRAPPRSPGRACCQTAGRAADLVDQHRPQPLAGCGRAAWCAGRPSRARRRRRRSGAGRRRRCRSAPGARPRSR